MGARRTAITSAESESSEEDEGARGPVDCGTGSMEWDDSTSATERTPTSPTTPGLPASGDSAATAAHPQGP